MYSLCVLHIHDGSYVLYASTVCAHCSVVLSAKELKSLVSSGGNYCLLSTSHSVQSL